MRILSGSTEGDDGVEAFVLVVDGVLKTALTPSGYVDDFAVLFDAGYELVRNSLSSLNTVAEIGDEQTLVCIGDFVIHIFTSLWTSGHRSLLCQGDGIKEFSRTKSTLYHKLLCLSIENEKIFEDI